MIFLSLFFSYIFSIEKKLNQHFDDISKNESYSKKFEEKKLEEEKLEKRMFKKARNTQKIFLNLEYCEKECSSNKQICFSSTASKASTEKSKTKISNVTSKNILSEIDILPRKDQNTYDCFSDYLR